MTSYKFFLSLLIFSLTTLCGFAYNIEIKPVDMTWEYDGTEHGYGHDEVSLELIVDGQSKGVLTSTYDKDQGWSQLSCVLGNDNWKDDSWCLLWLIRKQTSSGSTVLTIDITTTITDAGSKKVNCTCRIEQGSFERCKGVVTGIIWSYTAKSTTDITKQSNITVSEAYYTVTPKPLTIICNGAKEEDGYPLTSTYGTNTDDCYFQVSGLVSGESVTTGSFTTDASDVNTYTYGGSPTSTISTPFKIVKSNGANSTGNYDITYQSTQKIVKKNGLISRLIKTTDTSCPTTSDGSITFEIKKYDSSYKYYYFLDNNENNRQQITSTNPITISNAAKGTHHLYIYKVKNNNQKYSKTGDSDKDDYTIVINSPDPISLSATHTSQTVVLGEAIADVVITSKNHTTLTCTGLPDGLTFDEANAKITGTPTSAGTYTATITAKNDCEETTVTLQVEVLAIECKDYGYLSSDGSVSFPKPVALNDCPIDEMINDQNLTITDSKVSGELPFGQTTVTFTASRNGKTYSCSSQILLVKQVNACGE